MANLKGRINVEFEVETGPLGKVIGELIITVEKDQVKVLPNGATKVTRIVTEVEPDGGIRESIVEQIKKHFEQFHSGDEPEGSGGRGGFGGRH